MRRACNFLRRRLEHKRQREAYRPGVDYGEPRRACEMRRHRFEGQRAERGAYHRAYGLPAGEAACVFARGEFFNEEYVARNAEHREGGERVARVHAEIPVEHQSAESREAERDGDHDVPAGKFFREEPDAERDEDDRHRDDERLIARRSVEQADCACEIGRAEDGARQHSANLRAERHGEGAPPEEEHQRRGSDDEAQEAEPEGRDAGESVANDDVRRAPDEGDEKHRQVPCYHSSAFCVHPRAPLS